MEQNDGMPCTSCKKPKNQLKRKKSKVLSGVTMYLCQDCIDNKREPRGFIIIAGRQFGIEHVSYWIKNKKYVGSDISAVELTP